MKPRLLNRLRAHPDAINIIKSDALAWVRETFLLPSAEWEPGTPGLPDRCPITRILTRNGFHDVWTGGASVRYRDAKGQLQFALMPLAVRDFIQTYDYGLMPDLIYWLANPPVEPVKAQPEPDPVDPTPAGPDAPDPSDDGEEWTLPQVEEEEKAPEKEPALV